MQSSRTPSFADELIDKLARATTQLVEKPWGYEIVINAGDFILKYIEVYDHQRTSLQHHEHKREVSVVLAGRGGVRNSDGVLLGGLTRPSRPVVIEPSVVHRTSGRCRLLEVTTPEDCDIVRHEDDWNRT